MINYLDESQIQTMKMEYVMINNLHTKSASRDWTCVGAVEVGYQHKNGELVSRQEVYKLIGDNPNTLLPQMFSQFMALVGDAKLIEELYNESISSKTDNQTTSEN